MVLQHISWNYFNNFFIFLAISYCTIVTICVSFLRLCNNRIYCPIIMKARSPKSSVWKVLLPLKALGKNLSLPLPSFWQLLTTLGIPLLVASPLQSLPLLSHAFPQHVSLCVLASFYKDKSHYIKSPH